MTISIQGDQERKQLQITPLASMDRERQHELPQLQKRYTKYSLILI